MAGVYHELPKAELHLHLEGAVEPETMLELDPSLTIEEVRRRYEYGDFLGFLRSFKWVVDHLNTPDDYALVTRRLLEGLSAQNVTYAEIIFSAGVVIWRNMQVGPIYDAVRREAARSPVRVWWLFDAVRQFGVEHVQRVAELAAERVDAGVIGFGIGGDEDRGPAALFRDSFGFARKKGLRLTAHAGETGGPESVWSALEIGAERIGHGIRAIEDPALVRRLRDRDIPLEISISSNISTGAVRSLHEHPVRRLYDAGVPIVLNTDDPSMFHTTLVREYEIAQREFGFSEAELRGLAANSFRYGFRRME